MLRYCLTVIVISAVASVAMALPQSEEITTNTSANADQVYAWLTSGDPRLVAWGAYFSSKSKDAATLSKMSQILESWEPPQGTFEERTAQTKTMSAVLDSLIQRNQRVPVTAISSIASSFPPQAMILASQYSVDEITPLLLTWYEGRSEKKMGLLARFAAMRLTKAPPPGFAATILGESQEEITVNVRSDEKWTMAGGVGGACGDKLSVQPWTGWPPIYVYYLEENQHGSSDPVLVAAGGDRITYRRHDIYAGWGTCAHPRPLTDETRHHLLAAMVGIKDKQMPWQVQQELTIRWQNEEEFQRSIGSEIANEEPKLHATIEALYAKGLLTDSEARSVRPKLLVTVVDDRKVKVPPLPRLVFRDPRTVLNLNTR